MSGKIKALLCDKDICKVFEVGGNEGAIVLGHLHKEIIEHGYEHYMILNLNRLDTSNIDGIKNTMNIIENKSKIKITGIVLNNHLLNETTFEIIYEGYIKAKEMLKNILPIKYVCVNSEFINKAKDLKLTEHEEIFELKRIQKYVYEV